MYWGVDLIIATSQGKGEQELLLSLLASNCSGQIVDSLLVLEFD